MTIVAALSAVTVALACNDKKFLTEQPFDFIGPTNFYHNSGDALAAINGVYADFINSTGDDYYGRNFVMLGRAYDGDVDVAVVGDERAQPARRLRDSAVATPTCSRCGSAAFDAVNRANSVLDHVPAIDMDTTLRNRIIGEAKFLRATHYFNLVRMFGGVPLKLHETVGLDSLSRPRNTAQEVYAQIEQDLKDAIAALPSTKSYTGADVGRASRGAAKTLLAKVYLQRAGTAVGPAADWASALATAKQVQSDGDYSLVADYKSLFDFIGGTVNERNSEVIFDDRESFAPGTGRAYRLARRAERDRAIPRRVDERIVRGGEHLVRLVPGGRQATRRHVRVVVESQRDDRELRAEQRRVVALRERDAVPAQVPRSSR